MAWEGVLDLSSVQAATVAPCAVGAARPPVIGRAVHGGEFTYGAPPPAITASIVGLAGWGKT